MVGDRDMVSFLLPWCGCAKKLKLKVKYFDKVSIYMRDY